MILGIFRSRTAAGTRSAGTLSYTGWGATTLRTIEAVRQIRGKCGDRQMRGARAGLAGVGSDAQYYNVLVLRAAD